MPSCEVVNVGCNLKKWEFIKIYTRAAVNHKKNLKVCQYMLHFSVVNNQASDTLYLKLKIKCMYILNL